METKEAIQVLGEHRKIEEGDYGEALDVAIKALHMHSPNIKKSYPKIDNLLVLLELQALLISNPIKKGIIKWNLKMIRKQVDENRDDLGGLIRFLSERKFLLREGKSIEAGTLFETQFLEILIALFKIAETSSTYL